MEPADTLDMVSLAEAIATGETTPADALGAALVRLDAVNSDLTAVVHRFDQKAWDVVERGAAPGPFSGVPFLLKDAGAEAVDYPTTEGSRLMVGSRTMHDSSLFQRLAASGLVPFGRTATPENAIGIATEAAVYGAPTRNPWDLGRTPGGSSGGSAAAVAAGIVPAAHGSDGGGSIRVPASNCGLFGFKPTRGHMPDGPDAGEGWGGMASEGFLSRSVRDTAALLDATIGPDLGAPYRAPPLNRSFAHAIDRATGPLRIALCTTRFDGSAIDPACVAAVEDAAHLLDDMGHIVDVAVPDADHVAMMRAWCDIVACGTALSITAELSAKQRALRADDLEPLSHGVLDHARTLSGADYLHALSTIHAYGRTMAAFFRNWDILLTPTLAEPPAKIGRFAHTTEDYLHFRLGEGMCFDYSPFAAAFNASGQPAMSVPLYWSDGLPIGIHLAAAFGQDTLLMSLAADLERARPWTHRRPPLSAI